MFVCVCVYVCLFVFVSMCVCLYVYDLCLWVCLPPLCSCLYIIHSEFLSFFLTWVCLFMILRICVCIFKYSKWVFIFLSFQINKDFGDLLLEGEGVIPSKPETLISWQLRFILRIWRQIKFRLCICKQISDMKNWQK